MLGKETLELNNDIHDLAVCFINLKYRIKARARNIHFKHKNNFFVV